MKKWLGVVFIGSLIMLLILRDGVMKNPFGEGILPIPFIANSSNPLESIQAAAPPVVHNPEPANQVISADTLVSSFFIDRNFSHDVKNALLTCNHMKHLINYSQGLPDAVEALREAQVAWESLVDSFEKGKYDDTNESSFHQVKKKQCPHFLNRMNNTKFVDTGYKLQIPCGLIQGSTITIIGIPNGLLGSFRIDLAGEPLLGEPEPPLVLHYNVRLLGDKITKDPVIVQNTWTAAHEWGEEERCPLPVPGNNKKVDELNLCNEVVGKDDSQKFTASRLSNISIRSLMSKNGTKSRRYFPFKQGHLSVMTLRVGKEGIQMVVDGKHITSFAYRERLEPWLISEIRISGGLKLISVLAIGLPSSEKSEHVVDLEALKSAQLTPHQPLKLFIGVFSAANNFNRRMAVRKTWMQYPAVKTGAVAVRFFVGLHKNQMVNEELWTELQTYGDIQLMPFVDYYNLITWKTISICIFGADVVSAKYVMKTDDDAFVRVDEVLGSLNRTNVRHGLLYGLINYDAQPHRYPDSKWFISLEVSLSARPINSVGLINRASLDRQCNVDHWIPNSAKFILFEWPESFYPPFAHGSGYVVSRDIAKAVYERHKKGLLKTFKLEDVAMGIWIAEMKRGGLQVSYINENRFYNEGCEDGYIVAHYQSPRDMLCLWQKLQNRNVPECCSGQ